MWCMWSASQLMLWHSQCRWPWQLTAELASEFVLSKLPGLRYIRYMTYIKTGTVYKSFKWRFWMMSVSWERFLAFFSSNLSVAGCFFFQGKGGDLEVPRIFCSATRQQGGHFCAEVSVESWDKHLLNYTSDIVLPTAGWERKSTIYSLVYGYINND